MDTIPLSLCSTSHEHSCKMSISPVKLTCAAAIALAVLVVLLFSEMSRPWTQHEIVPVRYRAFLPAAVPTDSVVPERSMTVAHRENAEKEVVAIETALLQRYFANESSRYCVPIRESPVLKTECDGRISEVDKLLVFEMDASQGLGCQLLFILHIMKACEKMDIKPYFRMISNRSYQSDAHENNKTRDFFQYGFLNCGFTAEEYADAVNRVACGNVISHGVLRPYHVTSAIKRYATDKNLPTARVNIMSWSQNTPKSLIEANQILSRHLHVRPDLYRAAAHRWGEWFGQESVCVVGIHYRGNDKMHGHWAEAGFVSHAAVLQAVQRLVHDKNCSHIFVASDENEFVTAAVAWGTQTGLHVVTPPETQRCVDPRHCEAVHLQSHNSSYALLRESVTAMLMLSWCNFLVKTPSLFSAVSAILNPSMPVFLTHRPSKYNQFPEDKMSVLPGVQPGT